jgi:hypothetical protein
MVTDYITPMDKTCALLGNPKTSLQQGVNETITWLRTQPEFQPTPLSSPADHPTAHCWTIGKFSNSHNTAPTPRRAPSPGVFDFCSYTNPQKVLDSSKIIGG